MSSSHAILRAVEPSEPEPRTFCGYCGSRPDPAVVSETRVCGACGLGLLLTTDAGLAPAPHDAFVVVDAGLSIRAVSRGAEGLRQLAEIDVVDQALDRLLVPAESSDGARGRLHALVSGAARAPLSSAEPEVEIVRPARAFGVRYRALVGRCEPGRAALLVLAEL